MSLEDLVPPLSFCKHIPAGAFEDSVLVWMGDSVVERSAVFCDLVPAPTLAEIIPAIVEAGGFHPEIMYKPDDEGNGNHWEVECFTKEDPDTVEDFTIGSPLETDSINPATAALKLWLRLSVEDGK